MVTATMRHWANSYYYRSVGLSGPAATQGDTEITDDIIEKTYNEVLYEPLKKILNIQNEIPDSTLAGFLRKVGQVKVHGALHLIGTVFVSENVEDDAAKFLESAKPIYAIMPDGQPFKCYLNANGNEVLGNYYKKQSIKIIGELSRYPHGINLGELYQKDPWLLNDYDIQAIRACVKSEAELFKSGHVVPSGSGFVYKEVTALSKELPGYFVRKLVASLPEATIAEYPSPYHAAYIYAKERRNQYNMAYKELRKILEVNDKKYLDSVNNAETKGVSVNVSSIPEKQELTDDIVFKYLSDKYGTDVEVLREKIAVPTTAKLYTSAYLMSEEQKNMSAEELVNYVADNPNAMSGTLDEILVAFCKEEKFDTEDTVANLIKFINDEPLVERSVNDLLSVYIKDNSISLNTTINELLNNKTHVEISDKDVTLKYISNCGDISPEYRTAIIEAVNGKTPFIPRDLSESLKGLGLPDDLLTAILVAESTKKQFVAPKSTISDEEVVDQLVRKGIPRVTAENLMSGSPIIFEQGSKVSSKDNGYRCAEVLLSYVRKRITDDDDYQMRLTLLPIIYSYVRVLMMSKGDEQEVKEYLEGKMSECDEQCASAFNKAIEELMRED